MNEEEYATISQAMTNTLGGSSELSERVRITIDQDGKRHHVCGMTRDGSCQFLRDDHLCSLHARFGEAILPQTCFHFPKIRYLVGTRWEVYATLACPETARLCLLDPEAMSIVDSPCDPTYDKPTHYTPIDIRRSTPFGAHFDKVRGVLFVLGSLDCFPIASKLFMACYFASHVESFFHASCDRPIDHLLEQEIARICQDSVRQEIHDRFTAMQLSRQKCFEFMVVIMSSGFSKTTDQNYATMLTRAMQTYGATLNQGTCSVSMEVVIEKYLGIKHFWQQEFAQELEQYQTHYFLNHVMGVPYLKNVTLLGYLRGVLIDLAVIKFILFGLLGRDTNTLPRTREERKKRLEETMVKTVQTLSKAIHHNRTLLGLVEKKLDEQGITTLPHLVFLLQF